MPNWTQDRGLEFEPRRWRYAARWFLADLRARGWTRSVVPDTLQSGEHAIAIGPWVFVTYRRPRGIGGGWIYTLRVFR